MFRKGRDIKVPALSYPVAKADLDLNLIEILKARALATPDKQSQTICVDVKADHDLSLSQHDAFGLEGSEVLASVEEPIEEIKNEKENISLHDAGDVDTIAVHETETDDDLECLEAQMDDMLDISALEGPKESALNDDLNLDEEEDW